MAKQNMTHIVHRDLDCELTDADKAALSGEMAKAELGIEALKSEVAELNTKKRGLQGHLNELAHALDDGLQERSIECHWVEDLPHNVKRLVRQDTMEPIEEVALTAADLQEELPGTEDGENVTPIGKGKKGK